MADHQKPHVSKLSEEELEANIRNLEETERKEAQTKKRTQQEDIPDGKSSARNSVPVYGTADDESECSPATFKPCHYRKKQHGSRENLCSVCKRKKHDVEVLSAEREDQSARIRALAVAREQMARAQAEMRAARQRGQRRSHANMVVGASGGARVAGGRRGSQARSHITEVQPQMEDSTV
jgi:hypothetical protein